MRPEITIILPCQNEETALDFCLKEIKQTIKKNRLNAEIIVSDSSTDKSPEIALRSAQGKPRIAEVVLLKHDKNGYGASYLEALKIAKGKYIFMADADATYDFKQIPEFINQLKKGHDMAIGNRFAGKIEAGAMPLSNRYIGNPILSFILRLFFNAKINDSQCGMRAIKKQALNQLRLQTTGMEFASEMVVKALRNRLKIKEIPINYRRRKGKSKLRPYSDAWKHIRFMLLYSPLFLFFWPGLSLLFLGILSMLWLYFGTPQLLGIRLFYHPMFLSSLLLITGYQLVIFSGFAKIYSMTHFGEKNKMLEKLFKYITIEKAIAMGGAIMLFGAVIFIFIALKWLNSGFGELNEIKNSIVALTLMITGIQTIFSSFMLSILGIKR